MRLAEAYNKEGQAAINNANNIQIMKTLSRKKIITFG